MSVARAMWALVLAFCFGGSAAAPLAPTRAPPLVARARARRLRAPTAMVGLPSSASDVFFAVAPVCAGVTGGLGVVDAIRALTTAVGNTNDPLPLEDAPDAGMNRETAERVGQLARRAALLLVASAALASPLLLRVGFLDVNAPFYPSGTPPTLEKLADSSPSLSGGQYRRPPRAPPPPAARSSPDLPAVGFVIATAVAAVSTTSLVRTQEQLAEYDEELTAAYKGEYLPKSTRRRLVLPAAALAGACGLALGAVGSAVPLGGLLAAEKARSALLATQLGKTKETLESVAGAEYAGKEKTQSGEGGLPVSGLVGTAVLVAAAAAVALPSTSAAESEREALEAAFKDAPAAFDGEKLAATTAAAAEVAVSQGIQPPGAEAASAPEEAAPAAEQGAEEGADDEPRGAKASEGEVAVAEDVAAEAEAEEVTAPVGDGEGPAPQSAAQRSSEQGDQPARSGGAESSAWAEAERDRSESVTRWVVDGDETVGAESTPSGAEEDEEDAEEEEDEEEEDAEDDEDEEEEEEAAEADATDAEDPATADDEAGAAVADAGSSAGGGPTTAPRAEAQDDAERAGARGADEDDNAPADDGSSESAPATAPPAISSAASELVSALEQGVFAMEAAAELVELPNPSASAPGGEPAASEGSGAADSVTVEVVDTSASEAEADIGLAANVPAEAKAEVSGDADEAAAMPAERAEAASEPARALETAAEAVVGVEAEQLPDVAGDVLDGGKGVAGPRGERADLDSGTAADEDGVAGTTASGKSSDSDLESDDASLPPDDR